MKHFVIVGVLIVICTILVNMVLTVGNLLPAEASVQAVAVDKLFNVHFTLISFLFSLITVFIVYSLVVFRARPGQSEYGKFFKSNNRLEFIWTVVPLIIVLVLAYMGSQTLAEVLKVDPQAMVIKVTAFQWGWSFEYPALGITSNKLYLPVNKPILFNMTSKDVIHSFWVPEFRIKQDVLPGANLVKSLRITPSQIGAYTVRCAEMCGGSHAYMEAPVLVVSQTDFDQWTSSELSTVITDPAARGEKIVQTSGCQGCHSIDGSSKPGPTWKGLYGRTVDLADGTQVTADDAYIKESILKPAAKIVKGFPNIMPAAYTSLTDQQISDIIAYMKTLQ